MYILRNQILLHWKRKGSSSHSSTRVVSRRDVAQNHFSYKTLQNLLNAKRNSSEAGRGYATSLYVFPSCCSKVFLNFFQLVRRSGRTSEHKIVILKYCIYLNVLSNFYYFGPRGSHLSHTLLMQVKLNKEIIKKPENQAITVKFVIFMLNKH